MSETSHQESSGASDRGPDAEVFEAAMRGDASPAQIGTLQGAWQQSGGDRRVSRSNPHSCTPGLCAWNQCAWNHPWFRSADSDILCDHLWFAVFNGVDTALHPCSPNVITRLDSVEPIPPQNELRVDGMLIFAMTPDVFLNELEDGWTYFQSNARSWMAEG